MFEKNKLSGDNIHELLNEVPLEQRLKEPGRRYSEGGDSRHRFSDVIHLNLRHLKFGSKQEKSEYRLSGGVSFNERYLEASSGYFVSCKLSLEDITADLLASAFFCACCVYSIVSSDALLDAFAASIPSLACLVTQCALSDSFFCGRNYRKDLPFLTN